MPNVTIESVKDCDLICANDSHVLVSGRYLWLFRTDGTFVAKFKDIRHVDKVVFLPGNMALVDGTDGSYHYISLSDGIVVWSSIKRRKRFREVSRFAVSPDGSIIYALSNNISNALCLDCLRPEEKVHEQYLVKAGLRVTRDIFCDNEGILCAFQTHVIVDGDEGDSPASEPMSQNGILALPIDENGVHPYWKKQWQSKAIGVKPVRGCNGILALREDFSVLNLNTMEEFSLFTVEEMRDLPKDGFDWRYDLDRKLLKVYFIAEKLNILIDCSQRKVVSRYKREDWSVGYEGCLIGNEFWMGTKQGIVKRPFPNWD